MNALQAVARIFKEHYNIYHVEKPKGPASEIHFMPDARDFTEMVCFYVEFHAEGKLTVSGCQVQETVGWSESKLMTYPGDECTICCSVILNFLGFFTSPLVLFAEFMEQLHRYVDLKLKERGSLYDMAAHLF